jgi:hypothetical protein
MMETKINKARVFVTSKYKSEGSVLRETVKAVGLGFSTRLELESSESVDKVAAVVRNAENGCYVMQCLLNPVAVERTVRLNGMELNPQELFKKD